MTNRPLNALLLTLAASVVPVRAHAVPLQLAHQGRLLAADETPLDGTHDLTFRIYDAATDGAMLWEETVEETFTAGFYSTVLGADAEADPLDDGIFATPPVYLELTVDDGEPLLPRQAINSVPYALRAGTAENVEGGYVDATDIAINGTPVIDSSGTWVGATPAVDWSDLSGVPSGMVDGVDADVLAGLSCADQGVAKFDSASGLWACGLDEDTDTFALLGPTCLDGDRAAWDAVLQDWTCASEEVALGRLDTFGATTGQLLTYDGVNVSWDDPATPTNPACTLTAINEAAGGALLDCGGTALRLHAREEFNEVSAGDIHACGISVGGTVRCWGEGGSGEAAPPGGVFTQISSGWSYTCGIASLGTIQCWGWNSHGQSTPPTGTFVSVSGGRWHACAVAGDASIQCWGANNHTQATPPAGTFVQVSAGRDHTCALDTGGSVQCWGENSFGQSTPPSGVFTEVKAGSYHACGITVSGTVQCWGNNDTGQSAPPGGVFVGLGAGYDHTCGITASGSVQCWGKDNHGQSTPPLGAFSQVTGGGDHTCGILSTLGTLTCWGRDSSGQSSAP